MASFPRFHVAFVRKRLLDVEFIAFCEGLEVPRSAKKANGRMGRDKVFSVMTEILCISTGFKSRQGFPGCDKTFRLCVATESFVSRHGSQAS